MKNLALILSIFLGACTTMHGAEAREVFLIRATIKSMEATPESAAPQEGQLDLSAAFKVRLGAIEPLIGHLSLAEPYVTLKVGGTPKAAELKDIYVLGTKRPDGSLSVEYWSYVVNGLCVSRDRAQALSVEGTLRQLREKGGVKWDAGCDW